MVILLSLVWGFWILVCFLQTKFLLRIHHNGWRHVQTLHLSLELLHLLLLQLPPPAEQVEVDPLPGLHVHAHQQAVATRRVDKAGADGALVCPIVGEAAAFQGDVK